MLKTDAFLAKKEAQEVGEKRRSDEDDSMEVKRLRTDGGDAYDAPMPGGAASSTDVQGQSATMVWEESERHDVGRAGGGHWPDLVRHGGK